MHETSKPEEKHEKKRSFAVSARGYRSRITRNDPVMTVRLHRTPSGYWRFDVRYNHQIDIADRLFNSLAEHAGLEEKVCRTRRT